jgi:hypothetical protein
MAKQTAINLTNYAQCVKDKLAAAYGLKNVISAGLALLDAIEPTDRERLISIIADDSDEQIRAFVGELCARYTLAKLQHTPAKRSSKAG